MLVRIALASFLLASDGIGDARLGTCAGTVAGATRGQGEVVGEPRRYALVALGAGSTESTGPAGLSDTGFVTGSPGLRGEDGAPVGCRWTASTKADAIQVSGPSSWTGSTAADVNDSGTIVGSFGEDSPFLTRGYRWRNGVIHELFTPLGQRAFPLAINDAGWIVGYAGIQPPGTPGAVLWDPDLNASFVADLTRAIDINARGQVVGIRNDAAGIARGFLWSEGELIPLGSLDPRGAGAVYPKAIDERGRVVGVSFIRGREHAFRWTPSGGMTELFAPRPALRPGAARESVDVAALDLNDAGWMVGYTKAAGAESALLWAPDGTVHSLATLVPELASAGAGALRVRRINASGQIVGVLAGENGTRSVLLTPAAARDGTGVPRPVGLLVR